MSKSKGINVDPGGMSVAEIAEKEGCTPEEISYIIRKALAKLRGRANRGHFDEVNLAGDHFRTRNL
jgi:DNA-directed RNA polymerase specialized sigma24 family protein